MTVEHPIPGAGKGPLFFQRRFWPMWSALSLGAFADNVLRQSLLIGIPAGVIAVPFFNNPDNAIPYVGALLPVAIMLFSSVSGQLADKYETSMMFRRTKFAEIVLMGVAAIAFISGSGALAIAMLFFMGAQSAFFSPVRVSAMPKYLTPEELVRGNGLCNAGLFSAILVGYVVGGFLIVQPMGGAAVGAVLISAATLGWLASLRTLKVGANAPDLDLDFNAPAQTVAMFRHVFASRGVPPPLFGVGVFFFLSTAVTVAVPLYGRDALHADPLVWTALNGLFAIGAGIGAVAAAALAKGRSGLGYSTAAICAAGVASFSVYWLTPFAAGTPDMPLGLRELFSSPPGLALVAVFTATSALSGLYIAPLQAAMQRRAPAAVRARVLAASIFLNAAFAIPGSLSILAVTQFGVDPRLPFVAVGAAMLAIGGIMLWRMRVLPEGLYDEVLRRSG
ncbi:MAG: MFS transporter [Hyphococcus sp.]